jgi:hypothetical protein
VAIAIWAFKRKTPMHFWAGDEFKLKAEDFSDVSAYNRANGFMWLGYAISLIIIGVASLFTNTLFGIIVCAISSLGIIIMIFVHRRISKKYRVTKKEVDNA